MQDIMTDTVEESIDEVEQAPVRSEAWLEAKSRKRTLRGLQEKKVKALIARTKLTRAYEMIESVRSEFSGIFCDTMLRDCIAESLGQLSAVICDFELDPDYWDKQMQNRVDAPRQGV